MQTLIPDDLLDLISRLQERISIVEKSLTNDAVPIGALLEWPATEALLPFNYLPADGRAIDRVGYASLFAQIGTTHGVGDGSTSFNVPDKSCQIYMDASSTRSGCVLLDGASYLRATYPDLFNALGGAASPWGLPDGTHFNVPDLRGRTAIGSGTGAGLTARTLGVILGEENHQLSVAELAAHVHPPLSGPNFDIVTSGTPPSDAAISTATANIGINWTANSTTGSAGSNTAHNNMQPSGVFNFFISTTNSTVIKVL